MKYKFISSSIFHGDNIKKRIITVVTKVKDYLGLESIHLKIF